MIAILTQPNKTKSITCFFHNKKWTNLDITDLLLPFIFKWLPNAVNSALLTYVAIQQTKDENAQIYQFKIFAVDLGEPLVEGQSTYSQRQISNWEKKV